MLFRQDRFLTRVSAIPLWAYS